MHTRRIWDEQRRALHPPVALPTLGLGEGGAADGVVSTERSQIHNIEYWNNYKQPSVQSVQLVSTLLLTVFLHERDYRRRKKKQKKPDYKLKQTADYLGRKTRISSPGYDIMHLHRKKMKNKKDSNNRIYCILTGPLCDHNITTIYYKWPCMTAEISQFYINSENTLLYSYGGLYNVARM